MANVLHKTNSPADYRLSVNTPDFPSADWFHDPDVSAVSGVPLKYWRVGTNPVEEMNQTEKDAVDAAATAAALLAAKSEASSVIDGRTGYQLRALAKLLVDEINIMRQWDASLKTAFANNSTLGTIRTAVDALPNTPDRTLAQAKTAYKNLLSNGTLDE